jgi:hypothetical protein
MTNKNGCPPWIPVFVLQDRAAALGVAGCTYFMVRFARAHAFLQRVSEGAITQVDKLVPLLLCFPCFKASNFFFQLAYALNQRRASSLAANAPLWASRIFPRVRCNHGRLCGVLMARGPRCRENPDRRGTGVSLCVRPTAPCPPQQGWCG